MRTAGKIVMWKDAQGYGFIEPAGGGKQVFVHVKTFVYHSRKPQIGQTVSFNTEQDAKGRIQATKVLFAGERMPVQRPGKTVDRRADLFVFIAVVFLVFVIVEVIIGKVPALFLGLYLGVSLVAYFVYAMDKSAAQNNRWRVPEGTLIFLAVIGGWPGALIAQRLLRHKTMKPSFQFQILDGCYSKYRPAIFSDDTNRCFCVSQRF